MYSYDTQRMEFNWFSLIHTQIHTHTHTYVHTSLNWREALNSQEAFLSISQCHYCRYLDYRWEYVCAFSQIVETGMTIEISNLNSWEESNWYRSVHPNRALHKDLPAVSSGSIMVYFLNQTWAGNTIVGDEECCGGWWSFQHCYKKTNGSAGHWPFRHRYCLFVMFFFTIRRKYQSTIVHIYSIL